MFAQGLGTLVRMRGVQCVSLLIALKGANLVQNGPHIDS